MKSIILNCFILICILILPSCAIYIPQMVDLPLISKKKELNIDCGIARKLSAHATISYGLTKNIAIQTFGNINIDENNYLQGALGYFKKFDNNYIIEIYTGGGIGSGAKWAPSYNDPLNADYYLAFTQINYGKVDCEIDNVDFGFSLKSGYIYSYIWNLDELNQMRYFGDFYNYGSKNLLFEPVFLLRSGKKRLKFNFKLGIAWIHSLTSEPPPSNKIFNVGIGLHYKLKPR